MTAEQFRDLMDAKGWSVDYLAVQLMVSKNYIHHLRSGHSPVSPYIESSIADMASDNYTQEITKLSPEEKKHLTDKIIPYLHRLTDRARHGSYVFYG